MKTPNKREPLSPIVSVFSSLCLPLLTLVISGEAVATAEEGNAKSATVAVAPAEASSATNPPAALTVSRGVSGILKLADANVSPEVIKTYVESSPTAYQLTEADIIALKQHHVADDTVNLLLKRSAEVRAALAKSTQDAVARVLSERRNAAGGFDPDSYEYFQYYYLQPRALAAAYQRISPYYYPGFPYSYGYPPAFVFSPGYHGRSAYPRHASPARNWR